MNVSINESNEKLIAEINGRVDTTTAPEFQKIILEVLNRKPQRLVLDCSHLEYISSAGLRALLIIVKTAKTNNVNINLCALTDFVADVLETSGFDSLFEIKPTKND